MKLKISENEVEPLHLEGRDLRRIITGETVGMRCSSPPTQSTRCGTPCALTYHKNSKKISHGGAKFTADTKGGPYFFIVSYVSCGNSEVNKEFSTNNPVSLVPPCLCEMKFEIKLTRMVPGTIGRIKQLDADWQLRSLDRIIGVTFLRVNKTQ